MFSRVYQSVAEKVVQHPNIVKYIQCTSIGGGVLGCYIGLDMVAENYKCQKYVKYDDQTTYFDKFMMNATPPMVGMIGGIIVGPAIPPTLIVVLTPTMIFGATRI